MASVSQRQIAAVTLSLISLVLGINGRGVAAQTKKSTKPTSYALHRAPTGRDPFNRTQADTTDGFVALLRGNDALRQRYARHFGVSQKDVVDFVRTALVPYTLPSARTMTTFGVTKSGRIYPVKDHLRKGTKVWATREGVPVLKWTCSNPLRYELPGKRLTPPLDVAFEPVNVTPADSQPPIPVEGDDSESSRIHLEYVLNEPPMPLDIQALGSDSTVASGSLPGIGEIITAAGPVRYLWPTLLVPVFFNVPGKNGNNPPATSIPESNTGGLMALGLPVVAASALLVQRKRRA